MIRFSSLIYCPYLLCKQLNLANAYAGQFRGTYFAFVIISGNEIDFTELPVCEFIQFQVLDCKLRADTEFLIQNLNFIVLRA